MCLWHLVLVFIVIPLLKNAGLDKSNMDNYRAITISPVISKVFESYLLCTMQDFLFTSELQYGFKANKGCRDDMSVLCNTVEYYTRDVSTVNVACLDMSKAFDRVNLYALSIKLMELSVPKSFISIILDWYGKMLVSVKWNNSVSVPRRLLAGVCQGGVLSPSLFSVYVNDILCNLERSEFGCHVSGRYVGALMYADDLLLISLHFKIYVTC